MPDTSRLSPPPDWRERLLAILSDARITNASPPLTQKEEGRRFLKSALIWILALVVAGLTVNTIDALSPRRLPMIEGLVIFLVVFGVAFVSLRQWLKWEAGALGRIFNRFVIEAAVAIAILLLLDAVVPVPGLLGGAVIVILGWRALLKYKRLASGFRLPQFARDPISALREAKRPPVLFLRSFRFDDASQGFGWVSPATEEQAFVEALMQTDGEFTPVLALGRPRDLEPPPGAARFYVQHDIWERTVEAIVPLCSLVVWTSGHSEHLRWEIEHLIANAPPRRLLIWLHLHVGVTWRSARDAEWMMTREMYRDVFPKPLPADVEQFQCIAFDDDWTPRGIPFGSYWNRLSDRHALLRQFLRGRRANEIPTGSA